MNRAIQWLTDRVILASPYCVLWADDYVATGKRLQYVKRNTLFPSLVITGKMIHEAKERRRKVPAVKRKWHVLWHVRWVSVALPYPTLVVV